MTVDYESMSDDDLLDELHEAQKCVPGIAVDREVGLAAWEVVIELTRELERRYPPTERLA